MKEIKLAAPSGLSCLLSNISCHKYPSPSLTNGHSPRPSTPFLTNPPPFWCRYKFPAGFIELRCVEGQGHTEVLDGQVATIATLPVRLLPA